MDVKTRIELDMILVEAVNTKEYGLKARPNLMKLLTVYCDSVARDVPNFEFERESIISFIQELINSCSEHKAKKVLEQL